MKEEDRRMRREKGEERKEEGGMRRELQGQVSLGWNLLKGHGEQPGMSAYVWEDSWPLWAMCRTSPGVYRVGSIDPAPQASVLSESLASLAHS
jgi:hypothetical protein